jgi:hypothetical protein
MGLEKIDQTRAFKKLNEALVQDVAEGKLDGDLSSVTVETFQTSHGAAEGYNVAAKVWGLGDPVVYLFHAAEGSKITRHNGDEIMTPGEAAAGYNKPQRKGKRNPSRADRFSDAIGDVEAGKNELESLKDELESWRDNMPENLQQTQTYEMLETAIDELDNAINNAEEVCGAEVEFPGMFQG